jgi:heme o synthase
VVGPRHFGIFLVSKEQPAIRVISAFLNLARLRIVGMELVACAIGFIVAYRGEFLLPLFLWTLTGTALLSSGACTLNCYMEREKDALMPRTCGRPIPAGVISPLTALAYGVCLVLAGSLCLFWQVNVLAGILGLVAVFVYLAVYTPAKQLTWLNTSIGAVPGAIPPLIGWAAARGELDAGGWILFAMLFIWQHTHFFPIAWLYKNDYQAAGFQMLPVLEETGEKTFRLTVYTAIALLPVSMLLCGSNLTGSSYCFGAAIFGIILIVSAIRLLRQPSRAAALAVLHLSLFYLPVLLAAVILDRYGAQVGNNVHSWLATVCQWT